MSEGEFLCNPLYYVEVMRHRYADTLVEWCCNELSHVLDFSGPDGLGQVLMGKVDIRQGKTIIRKFTRHRKKATPQPQLAVFGVPLTEEGYSQARQLIDFLKDYVHKEGLFRIPGNSSRQQRLKDLINQGGVVNLENSEFTPHDIACVLKTFLGDLPEPLLTDRHYVAHLQAAELTYKLEILPHHTTEMLSRLRATRTASHVTALRYLFLMLRPCTYKLLREVMELLYTVTQNEDTTKMNASSLGIIFAPHLLWPRYLTTNDLKDQPFINKLNYAVEFMITYYKSIFKIPDSMLKKCEAFVKNGGTLPEDEEETMDHYQSEKSDDELDSAGRIPIGRPQPPSVSTQSTKSYTEEALSQLYANVQAMPDGAKKRKLMKQFAKSSYLPGTPTKVRDDALQASTTQRNRPRRHERSRSAGDAILKQLGTPFNSRKKRLAPNPPPQKVHSPPTRASSREVQAELRTNINNLNSTTRRRANSQGSPISHTPKSDQRIEMNIPVPAPRTPGSTRRHHDHHRRPHRPRKPPTTNQDQKEVNKPVLKPQNQNITPTRKAPTAPPKKYTPGSPYIPPPRMHSSPKDMDWTPTRGQGERRPVPAPRTMTPPATNNPRKRRSDGQPVDSPMVVDSQPGSTRRPVARPRIEKTPAMQTAV